MKDKFSPEFLAKYQYRPTTNFVISALEKGVDVLHAFEIVLKNYEDHIDETIKEKILYGELGPAPKGVEDVIHRVHHFTNVITADIYRKLRPWYKHPKYHVNHWEVSFPLFKQWFRKKKTYKNVDDNLRATI